MCGQTPYEAFHGHKPTLRHLKPFGGKYYLHIPKAKLPSGSKLLPRAELGVFVGYGAAQHHYKIYTPSNGRLTISADVTFPPSEDKAVAPSSHQQSVSRESSTMSTDINGKPLASVFNPVDDIHKTHAVPCSDSKPSHICRENDRYESELTSGIISNQSDGSRPN